MKQFVIVLISIVVGWLLGSMLVVGLGFVGLDIAAFGAQTWDQYRAQQMVWSVIAAIGLAWALYSVLSRRFLPRTEGKASMSDRIRSAVQYPSVIGLVVAWVLGLATIIAYPLAFWMTWRYFVVRREGETKVCPRCAERVKSAAAVCRHCGAEFQAIEAAPAA
jgi:hypothetical protein